LASLATATPASAQGTGTYEVKASTGPVALTDAQRAAIEEQIPTPATDADTPRGMRWIVHTGDMIYVSDLGWGAPDRTFEYTQHAAVLTSAFDSQPTFATAGSAVGTRQGDMIELVTQLNSGPRVDMVAASGDVCEFCDGKGAVRTAVTLICEHPIFSRIPIVKDAVVKPACDLLKRYSEEQLAAACQRCAELTAPVCKLTVTAQAAGANSAAGHADVVCSKPMHHLIVSHFWHENGGGYVSRPGPYVKDCYETPFCDLNSQLLRERPGKCYRLHGAYSGDWISSTGRQYNYIGDAYSTEVCAKQAVDEVVIGLVPQAEAVL
jgi:hypothetical protein